MKRLLPLLALLGAGCSVTHERCDFCEQQQRRGFGFQTLGHAAFVDDDEDGLPDARIVDTRNVVFVDTDNDGLPDKRAIWGKDRGRGDDRLEDALENLERAIAEVRAAMHSGR